MNEASSKYVDQLSLDKLLSEKLELVHHYPQQPIDYSRSILDDLSQLRHTPLPPFEIRNYGYTFESSMPSGHSENDHCYVHAFECENAKASVIFQHGLFEDNRMIYTFLLKNLNRLGLNVYLSTLPFHYERKPLNSMFSGEFFWSADFERTRNSYIQGIFDLYAVYKKIQIQNQHTVIVTGFSMGGAIALLLSLIINDISGIIAINPAVSLSGIVWDSPLCKTIKQDFLTAGYTWEQLKDAYTTFEPASVASTTFPSDRCMICYGLYDQITSTSQYFELIKKWTIKQVHEYKSGHLNTLRVPRLAQDISNFVDTL